MRITLGVVVACSVVTAAFFGTLLTNTHRSAYKIEPLRSPLPVWEAHDSLIGHVSNVAAKSNRLAVAAEACDCGHEDPDNALVAINRALKMR